MTFEEKQGFRHWLIWTFFIAFNLFNLYGLYQQLVLKIPFGNKPFSDTGMVIFTLIFLLFSLFFYKMNLKTKFDEKGIYLKFWPFHFTYRFYDWNDIRQAEVQSYSPLFDYGGWGIRYGAKGKAFNVSGNKGLQLEFTNGRRLLIGTQKAEELSDFLNKIGKTSTGVPKNTHS